MIYDLFTHQGYTYDSATSQPNSYVDHVQGGTEHLPQVRHPHHGQNYQHESGGYIYSSAEMAEYNGVDNSSAGEGYEQETCPHTGLHHGVVGNGDGQGYEEHVNVRKHFQVRIFKLWYFIQLLI